METTEMMIETPRTNQESKKLWQYLAAFSASILAIGVGSSLAWTSPVLIKLSAKDSWLPVSEEQGSWVSSLLAIGAMAGAFPAGSLADKLGRKKALLLLAGPFLLSWTMIVFAKSVWVLYIARFVGGISVGASCVLVPTYIAEIASPSARGTLGAIFQLFLAFGIVLTFVLGSTVSYTVLGILCGLVEVIFIAAFFWMPESPMWLVGQGRKPEASIALGVFRGDGYDTCEEISEMQREVEENATKKSSVFDLIKTSGARKAVLASFGLMAFQQLSGVNAVIFYTVTIFKAAGSSLNSDVAAIIVALVQAIMAGVAALIVDRSGRKPLLIFSSSFMAISLVALGLYFNLKDGGKDVSNLGWLPLVSLTLFMIAFSVGLGPIPWMIMGELFTTETKAMASGLAVMLNWFLVFLVTKTFPSMKEQLGAAVTFWVFAGIMVVATVFEYFFVLETKGKTLQEIQCALNGEDQIERTRRPGCQFKNNKKYQLDVRADHRPTMATKEDSSIEGRYKEYQYEAVATSLPVSPPDLHTTLDNKPDNNYSSITYVDNRADPCDNKGFFNSHKFNKMEREKGSKLFQFIAATAANIAVVAGGATLGWTSPILLMLKKDPVSPDNPIGRPISEEEASWIGSLTPVGALVGGFFAGYLAETFGRRATLLSSVIPSTLGWILIATGQSVEMFYVARFIFGVALSISFAVLPMYCGEIAETSIRGILGSFLQLFITIGLLWAYSIGPYVSYTSFWISCAALPIAFFVLFFTMPESPYYLAAKGRKEDVVSALVRLRGKSEAAVRAEADEIETTVRDAYSKEAKITDLFTIKANFKALIFTCLLVIFQQMTGINVVLFYSENIFASAGNSGISSSIETIIVGIVQFLASGVTPLVVDRLGRKILLIISGTGTAISLGILGLFFYLKDEAKNDVSNIGWLPIASLIIFIATYSIGWGPLPWTVMGEMFSTEVKSKASGIVVFACWFLGFLITKYFSNIAAAWGQYTAFWLFGVFCVLSVLFTVFILPETKGKSLQEIQDELSGTSHK
ncbi:facilitated trehalose transporter Tret1-1-like [Cotesia glomerata]|uniref:facilitated trehalose transporter Tret1-1-like n=1 Tax=Cotesia glomerata TaxID=32391 RepID=UPI001D00856B|nr:facilitated trehalose transporter Tret1-1-like [Cotesia glomerata]